MSRVEAILLFTIPIVVAMIGMIFTSSLISYSDQYGFGFIVAIFLYFPVLLLSQFLFVLIAWFRQPRDYLTIGFISGAVYLAFGVLWAVADASMARNGANSSLFYFATSALVIAVDIWLGSIMLKPTDIKSSPVQEHNAD